MVKIIQEAGDDLIVSLPDRCFSHLTIKQSLLNVTNQYTPSAAVHISS
jgi:hypothetical protein